jgi:hypothetical protein
VSDWLDTMAWTFSKLGSCVDSEHWLSGNALLVVLKADEPIPARARPSWRFA